MRLHPLLPLLAVPLVAGLTLTPNVTPTGAPTGTPTGPGSGASAAARALAVTASGLDAAQDRDPGDAMLSRTNGTVPVGAWQRASAQARASAVRTRAAEPTLASAAWQLKGPTNIGGRVLDVVVDPKKIGSVYLATASGGVWHTADAGSDLHQRLARGQQPSRSARSPSPGPACCGPAPARPAPVEAPSPTAGTGSGAQPTAAAPGRTWACGAPSGSAGSSSTRATRTPSGSRPTARSTPPAASAGSTAPRTAARPGQLVLAGENATTGAVDVALDPVDPKTVYMTMWDRIRYPDRRVYTGVGSGVFKSTDAWLLVEPHRPAVLRHQPRARSARRRRRTERPQPRLRPRLDRGRPDGRPGPLERRRCDLHRPRSTYPS